METLQEQTPDSPQDFPFGGRPGGIDGILDQLRVLRQASGKVTMLRVNEVNDRYGPKNDNIVAEVIFKIDRLPRNAFGFELRNDGHRPVRQGMLDLLRDAFNHGWKVTTDYKIIEGRKNGESIRIWLTK